MVEAPKYVIYPDTTPHTRPFWAGSVDAIQTLLIGVVEIQTRNLLSR